MSCDRVAIVTGGSRDIGSAKAIAVQADVSIESEVVRLYETVDEQLGAVTVLVNNAGIVRPESMSTMLRPKARSIH